MVHIVRILAFTPKGESPGRLKFELFGQTYNARCDADPQLADGLLVSGSDYPVTISMEAEGNVEYEDGRAASLTVTEPSETGDKVTAVGRVWDVVDHQVIRLEAEPSLAVVLNLPQTASDYRGGSWLTAKGLLCTDLPPEEHD